MADTNISDAVVFPEDDGTGVTDGSEDYNSAGYLGLLARNVHSEYWEGLGFTGNDSDSNGSWDELTIATGHAFVQQSSVTVQSGDQTNYDATLPNPITHVVVLPTSATITVSEGVSTLDVYLAFDPTSNDSAYVRHGDTNNISVPSDPNVYLGSIDTSSNTASEAWGGISMSEDMEVRTDSGEPLDLVVGTNGGGGIRMVNDQDRSQGFLTSGFSGGGEGSASWQIRTSGGTVIWEVDIAKDEFTQWPDLAFSNDQVMDGWSWAINSETAGFIVQDNLSDFGLISKEFKGSNTGDILRYGIGQKLHNSTNPPHLDIAVVSAGGGSVDRNFLEVNADLELTSDRADGESAALKFKQRGADPTTDDLEQGEVMQYVSDGTADVTGSAGDLVYAINDGGTIETQIIVQESNAT